jgi:hypothetical protein
MSDKGFYESGRRHQTHANSLSMLSPKPGVSTIVNPMRTPSSSSSKWREGAVVSKEDATATTLLTNVDGLDANSLLNVRVLRVVRDLVS